MCFLAAASSSPSTCSSSPMIIDYHCRRHNRVTFKLQRRRRAKPWRAGWLSSCIKQLLIGGIRRCLVACNLCCLVCTIPQIDYVQVRIVVAIYTHETHRTFLGSIDLLIHRSIDFFVSVQYNKDILYLSRYASFLEREKLRLSKL